MEGQMKEKKIRWNISKSMACVNEALKESKLKIKPTMQYKKSMTRLQELYNLKQTQVWILCLTCEIYFTKNFTTDMKNLASELKVSAMSIISWKKEIESLIEAGFLEWNRNNYDFLPTCDFCDCLYKNTEFIPKSSHEIDDVKFLNYFADRYESRRSENMSAYMIQRELREYENKHNNLEMIKRVMAEIKEEDHRFFIYDMANDLIEGCYSGLNRTIADLYDGYERYSVATKMMDESHKLFKKGLLEFVQKGNLNEAIITLSSKGKKLVLGDKAFLF